MATTESPYTPLDDPEDIRLLRVLPSVNPTAELDFTVEHVSLNDASVTYEAISYTWQPSYEETAVAAGRQHYQTVAVNGFVLTSNVYLALLRFRLSDEPRILWADALCTNQEDDTEKSHQVSTMRYEQRESSSGWVSRSKARYTTRRSRNWKRFLRRSYLMTRRLRFRMPALPQ